jgi:phage baseplate assembly protein W
MSDFGININFPFKDDSTGKFLQSTLTTEEAVKADLLHLLLTNKKERLYLPSFGTNLKRYIFEQNDSKTEEGIRTEIQTSINKFIPNLTINKITIDRTDKNEHVAIVRIDYTVTSNTFSSTDFVIVEL